MCVCEHWQSLDTLSLDDKAYAIMYCRLDKTWAPESRRLSFCIRDPQLRRLLLDCLGQTGAQRKLGRAPRGGLERELETWLDGLRV